MDQIKDSSKLIVRHGKIVERGCERFFYANTRRDAARIGFDDEALYREVARPISRRKIFMKQLLHREALAVFAEWKTKPDKIRY